jgi:hypothetical protein
MSEELKDRKETPLLVTDRGDKFSFEGIQALDWDDVFRLLITRLFKSEECTEKKLESLASIALFSTKALEAACREMPEAARREASERSIWPITKTIEKDPLRCVLDDLGIILGEKLPLKTANITRDAAYETIKHTISQLSQFKEDRNLFADSTKYDNEKKVSLGSEIYQKLIDLPSFSKTHKNAIAIMLADYFLSVNFLCAPVYYAPDGSKQTKMEDCVLKIKEYQNPASPVLDASKSQIEGVLAERQAKKISNIKIDNLDHMDELEKASYDQAIKEIEDMPISNGDRRKGLIKFLKSRLGTILK